MEKTWLKQYPAGVPAEIDVAQYASLVALLDESFRRFASAGNFDWMNSATLRPAFSISVRLGTR